jgi:hypothetical protein
MTAFFRKKKKYWAVIVIAVSVFFWSLSEVMPRLAQQLDEKGYEEGRKKSLGITGTLTFEEQGKKKKVRLDPIRFPLTRQSHPLLDREKFSLKIIALLEVKKAGLYWIGSDSDDGSWIRIDNEQVLDNGGLHPRQEKTNLMDLRPGIHPLEIRFENRMGEAYLDVFWIGPEGVRSSLAMLPHPWGKESAFFRRLGYLSFKIAQYWTFLMLPVLLYPLLFPVRPSEEKRNLAD